VDLERLAATRRQELEELRTQHVTLQQEYDVLKTAVSTLRLGTALANLPRPNIHLKRLSAIHPFSRFTYIN
jgi:hypothetical protein